MDNIITQEHIDAYGLSLLADERSAGMISRYRHDLTAFTRWLDGRIGSKETARRMEKLPEPLRLCTAHDQFHAGGGERLLPVCRSSSNF